MSQARKAKGTVWIGTSGWVYEHWRNGVFYPKGLVSNQQLEFYADNFKTVEINFSFYRLPERSVFESWRKQTPKGFLFAVKGSRYLTHMKKLNDPEESLERLQKRAAGLKEKLGPILFQFPHTWIIHTERLENFVRLLRSHRRQRFAFEFRHKSWLTHGQNEFERFEKRCRCVRVLQQRPQGIRDQGRPAPSRDVGR